MRRSLVETAIHIVLKGNPEETEDQIQKIYDLIVTPESKPTQEITNQNSDTPEETTDSSSTEESTYFNPFEPMLEKSPTDQTENAIASKDLGNLSEY
jgi:hypothetical protein